MKCFNFGGKRTISIKTILCRYLAVIDNLMKPISVFLVLISTLLVFIFPVLAVEPMEAVKGPVEAVISILKDPEYATAPKEVRQEKIWAEVQKIFNFPELSKRTLGRNWEKFSPDEQKRFTDTFGRLLGNTYISKVIDGFKNESVMYVEQKVADGKALVKTKIIRSTMEIPVDYKLLLNGEQWSVYDVNIEGVSLVQNYRSQFNTILRKSTPAELIDRIEEKISHSQQNNQTIGDSFLQEMVSDRLTIALFEENHFQL